MPRLYSFSDKMSSNQEISPSTDQQINTNNPVTTNQTQSQGIVLELISKLFYYILYYSILDQLSAQADVQEIDVAQADQSDRYVISSSSSYFVVGICSKEF